LLKSQGNTAPWILPANICPIVPVTFFKAGVPFEFVDISAETLHMDLEQARRRLERGSYGGVLYAHTYGEPSTPQDFFRQVKSRSPGLLVVDDRCLCVPELDPPQSMSADVALYSTGYAKIVEMNFGGYAFIKEEIAFRPEVLPFDPKALEEIEKSYKFALQNRSPYVYTDSDWLETNTDLPAWYDYRQQIEAGLETSLQQREKINEIYAGNLPPGIQLPPEYQAWRFNLRVKNKDHVLKKIFTSGLFASSHYASLVGIMASGRCPQAESLASEIINLFNDHHFDPQKAFQICMIIMENL
jgi:dTDP-4-amino-4,6-dideoxygalactose transaminase